MYSNPSKGNAKKCSNYWAIALSPHASKVMLKILQARLQRYVNGEFLDVQVGFRKGRGTRDQIANLHWIRKKQGNSRKTSTSASLTVLKPLTVCITTNCEKFLKRWEYQTTSQLSDFTFTFLFHALEKEMATHSSILAWKIPGMQEPCGLVYGVYEFTESDMTEAN